MNIRVDLKTNIADGSEVVFRSPADCSQVTGLAIYHHGGKTEFAFADAHGNNVGDIDHLFAENAVVKVILDVTAGMAFVQNADTNAYIERTFVKTINGKAPDEKGNVEVKVTGFIPSGGDPNMEVRFDAAHAQMMTAPEFVIADPENPFGSIILTKEGAAEDEDEPKNIAVLQKATGEPVILRGIETPTDPLDAVNLRKLVEYYRLLKQYADGKSVNVSHGKLGQHLAVAAVNQDGEIAGWKVEDPASVGFRHIRTVTIPEDITTDTSGVTFAEAEKGGALFGFDRDNDGKPFAIKEFFFRYSAGSPTESAGNIAFANCATPGYNNSMGFGVNRKLGTNGSKNSGNIYFCNKFILYNSASGAGAATLEPCLSTSLGTFTAFSCYHHGVYGLGFAPGSTFTLYGR